MISDPPIEPPRYPSKIKTKTSKSLAAADQSSDEDSDESEGDVGYINYKDKKQRYKFNFTLEPVRDNPDGTDGVQNQDERLKDSIKKYSAVLESGR